MAAAASRDNEIRALAEHITPTAYCSIVARAIYEDPKYKEPLEAWPLDPDTGKKERFADAYQPERIARLLVPALTSFEALRGRQVRYLYTPKDFSVHGAPAAGKLVRVTGPMRHITELDYLMVLSHKTYLALPPWQRVSLVYHELLHGEDDEKGNPALRPHDFEGFMEELEVFGENTFQRWLQMREAFERARDVDARLAQRDFWDRPDDGTEATVTLTVGGRTSGPVPVERLVQAAEAAAAGNNATATP